VCVSAVHGEIWKLRNLTWVAFGKPVYSMRLHHSITCVFLLSYVADVADEVIYSTKQGTLYLVLATLCVNVFECHCGIDVPEAY
jgi:hypothetical protein